jgi:hypothetical protein
MKLVARLIAALAVVAYSAPALACGAEKAQKTAQESHPQSGPVAKADEKSQKAPEKSEKSEKAKGAQARAQQGQKAAVAN